MKTLTNTTYLFISFVLITALSGCAKKIEEQQPAPKRSTSRGRVDTKAQQQYYDLGLKYYTDENYTEAKKAFQQVIQNGPDTSLGVKARHNLDKTEQILKTLKEMEDK